MKLSIIIPVLDEANGIEAALAGLQALRDQGHELIVVDGGSVDGTLAHATPLADQILTTPHGRARQMNAGAAVARGDVLLFLHADTRLPEHAVPVIRSALRYRLWGRFDVRIEGRSGFLRVVAWMMNLRSRLTGFATGDQAIFVSRTAFHAAGGFPDQPLMEDLELSRRLKRLGPPACPRERVVTSGRRWEANGVGRTILLMWRLRFDYWRGVPADRLAARYHPQGGRLAEHDAQRSEHRSMTATRILVFAKAPVPGRVKTRLIPALGEAGAARLAKRMLAHTLENACSADIGPVELCVSPTLADPAWAGYTPPPGVQSSLQGKGDLGARMARATQRVLAQNERVVLIGTDCPALSARHLREAAAALDCHEAVIVPAVDGGYAAIGLGTFHPSLFEDIPWSTARVAELTLARMEALRWCVAVGKELHDIDEPGDLVHLPDHLGLAITHLPVGENA